MKIPLDQFEQHIDEKILQRGLDYFQKGRVHDLEEVSPHNYEAVVEGSEDYFVELTVENDVVTDYSCDCPYDMGPVCKHVAAVIFALQEEKLGLTEKTAKSKNKTKSPAKKQKSPAEQLKELLGKASVDELKELISKEASRNMMFRNHVMTSLEHYNDNVSKEFYRNQVRAMIKSAMGRYDYLDWNGAMKLGGSVLELLALASRHVERKAYEKAAYICFAVIEEMFEPLQYADDSGGYISSCIDEAMNVLGDMTTCCDSVEIRQMISDYCADAFEKAIFEGFDWHTTLLFIAADFAVTDDEFDRIMTLADSPKLSEYDNEMTQMLKYETILKRRGKDKALVYLEQHLDNPRLRKEAINIALAKNDYNKAIKLAEDGVRLYSKNKIGLAGDFYEYLLKIAQTKHDTPKIIEYARYLLIDNFRHEQDYYQILKENVNPDEWETFINKLIQDIKTQKRWNGFDQVASLYIREKKTEKLLEMVKTVKTLETLEHYDSYCTKDYPKEIADLYSYLILKYLEQNVSREHYHTACRYIIRMRKYGEKGRADQLVEKLRALYPRRPALMDELNMI